MRQTVAIRITLREADHLRIGHAFLAHTYLRFDRALPPIHLHDLDGSIPRERVPNAVSKQSGRRRFGRSVRTV